MPPSTFAAILSIHYKNHSLFDREFWYKKPPYGFFGPHVQLDQNAIMDKLFWI
jgi:hypothetical protein